MPNHPNIFRLTGNVQHYEWGGYDFLPSLLNISNPTLKPFAEYWMGTHPMSPSMITNGTETHTLSSVVTIPYLLKILDIKEMLSIQVHPSKKAAEIEFARENNERIPLDAPHRNYRDDNHKPELLVALGEFWLLHGFKTRDKLLYILNAVPEFETLLPVFDSTGYEGLYKTVMGMPQETVNIILSSLLGRIVPLYQAGVLKKNEEDHWAAKAALSFNKNGLVDRGIFSVYFFNLVKLEKSQGLFQAAGVPHAYLEGQCVEIMANSDNVLRGGLTRKHIDVKELMKHIRCEPIVPTVLNGTPMGDELVYETDVNDFVLSVIKLNNKQVKLISSGTEIIFVLTGDIELHCGTDTISLNTGQSAVILPRANITIRALGNAEVYKAVSLTHQE